MKSWQTYAPKLITRQAVTVSILTSDKRTSTAFPL
jgi:hypothetical protein